MIITYIALLLLALTVIMFLTASIRILREYKRGVIFTLGRFSGVKGPGLIILIPLAQQMVKVDLRVVVRDACLLEQGLRLLGVVGVGAGEIDIAEIERRVVGADRNAVAVHRAIDDSLAVDRIGKRAPYPGRAGPGCNLARQCLALFRRLARHCERTLLDHRLPPTDGPARSRRSAVRRGQMTQMGAQGAWA
jgi:hypothetical protein